MDNNRIKFYFVNNNKLSEICDLLIQAISFKIHLTALTNSVVLYYADIAEHITIGRAVLPHCR